MSHVADTFSMMTCLDYFFNDELRDYFVKDHMSRLLCQW